MRYLVPLLRQAVKTTRGMFPSKTVESLVEQQKSKICVATPESFQYAKRIEPLSLTAAELPESSVGKRLEVSCGEQDGRERRSRRHDVYGRPMGQPWWVLWNVANGSNEAPPQTDQACGAWTV